MRVAVVCITYTDEKERSKTILQRPWQFSTPTFSPIYFHIFAAYARHDLFKKRRHHNFSIFFLSLSPRVSEQIIDRFRPKYMIDKKWSTKIIDKMIDKNHRPISTKINGCKRHWYMYYCGIENFLKHLFFLKYTHTMTMLIKLCMTTALQCINS
jgi:hypothetical protein